MSATDHAPTFVAMVYPSLRTWMVSCSCGYTRAEWPTQALARADMDNHVARYHAPDDDDS